MNEFFLQCAAGLKETTWEQVDQFVYDNYQFVVNDDGERRYAENRFCVIEGEINLRYLTASKAELGVIMRLLGVTIPQGFAAGGFAKFQPDTLLIHKKNSKICYRKGVKYKLAA